MALGISHRLLREMRMRVLVYDLAKTAENHDRLIVAVRAVAANYDKAHTQTLARQNASRRALEKKRLDNGLCRVCGKTPHRPERKSCVSCGKRQVESAKRLRQSFVEWRDELPRRRGTNGDR